jgi:hypothetical protein
MHKHVVVTKYELKSVDEQGFRVFLAKRNLTEKDVMAHVSIVREFQEHLKEKNGSNEIDKAMPNDFDDFSEILMKEGRDTLANMLALARYALFANNKTLTVHSLELVDGADVMENLSRNLKQKAGEAKWREIFGDIKLPALVTHPRDKSKITKKVMERLESKLEKEKCREVLSSNLHFVPDEAFMLSKKAFQESKNIDDFLHNQHKEYVEELAEHAKEKTLYFTQEVDDEVVEYVRETPTCQVGVRDEDVIYVTKIPYMAKKYLHETNEKMKRYYACHCPWVREAIKSGIEISPEFCYCSAGFEKRLWDVIFERPVKADVLQTVLKGDLICRFAIHIPREYTKSTGSRNKKKPK